MKKLLKSEVCGSREQCMGPTDVLKMAKKSKFLAIVHAQYMNSSLCLPLRVPKKKNAKEENADAESKRSLCPFGLSLFLLKLKTETENTIAK